MTGLAPAANVQHGTTSLTALKVTVQDFCKGLPSPDSRLVRTAVDEIARLQRQIAINVLAIGEALHQLRRALGSQKFHQFMTDVLPQLGVSRSTGYRWLSLAESLPRLFPNPVVRHYLLSLTDGKGIVASPNKRGPTGRTEQLLTPAAQTALRRLPPAPTNSRDDRESERWVREFIRTIGKARWKARADGRSLGDARNAIVHLFTRFALRYGTQAAEDVCGDMDKILNKLVAKHSTDLSGRNPLRQILLPHSNRPLPTIRRSGSQPYSQLGTDDVELVSLLRLPG